MKSRCQSVAYLLLAITSAAVITGCTSSSEFTAVPQEGASRAGIYPTFNNPPQAATKQMSAEEQQQMTSRLDREKSQLRAVKSAAPVTNAELDALRKKAQEEEKAVLKAIETSGD